MTLRSWVSVKSRVLRPWGIDLMQGVGRARTIRATLDDRREFRQQLSDSGEANHFVMGRSFLITNERTDEAGQASGHYFHQDLLVAREIFERSPRRHVDVGSAIYGFVSHVASFRDIEVIDVRPLHTNATGIVFKQADLLALDIDSFGTCDSLSCLHALEHFGLGRYGDEVDVNGWRKGLDALDRLLQPGGVLYLSVPTGSVQRVEFNAHRVFSLPYLRSILLERFDLDRLAFVTDEGDLVAEVDPFGRDADESLGAHHGCSIWILRKPARAAD